LTNPGHDRPWPLPEKTEPSASSFIGSFVNQTAALKIRKAGTGSSRMTFPGEADGPTIGEGFKLAFAKPLTYNIYANQS